METTVQPPPDRVAPAGAPGPVRPSRSRRALTLAGSVAFRYLLPLATAALVIGLWQWATMFFEIRPLYLPSPLAIAQALESNADRLLEQSRISVLEALAGFAIGGTSGLLLAVPLAASRVVERAVLPLIISLNAIPVVAIAPMLAVWMGFGSPPRITLAALICFFPIMIATMAGLTSTPAELHEMARSLSARPWHIFFKIRLPWAVPQIFVGLKLGMTLAVIGMVVAQLARPDAGLGETILKASQAANTTLVFAAIFLLMVISLTLFYTVVTLERLLVPWARETAAARNR